MKMDDYMQMWNALSEDERMDINMLYRDENVRIRDILKKFDLNIPECKLTKFITPEEGIQECIYCNKKMFRPVVRSIKKDNIEEFCANCGHSTKKRRCSCTNCLNIRAAMKEAHFKIEEEKRREKRERIIAKWCGSEDRVDVALLSAWHKVLVGIILYNSVAEKVVNIRFDIGMLCPNEDDAFEIIMELLRYKIIIIDKEKIDESAFSQDGNEIINIERVYFVLNLVIHRLGQIQEIYEGRLILQEDEVREIWKRIATQELIRYLLFRMKAYGMTFVPGKKTYTILGEILDNFSVGQGMKIINSAIQKVCLEAIENKYTKEHSANRVIRKMEVYAENALKRKWEIVGFSKVRSFNLTCAEYYIYSKLLRIGNDGTKICSNQLKDIIDRLKNEEREVENE